MNIETVNYPHPSKTRQASGSHIRPLDPLRDMPAVLDLIEIGFKDELDPQGWKMLSQMRQLYQPGLLGKIIYHPGLGTQGFVWVQDGRIVGNLSLRHAQPRSGRGLLIGNVVVHPDYRQQGVGRALMEHAIAAARRENAPWIGLEVRADNAVASTLYDHLGFKSVGIVKHLLRPKDLRWPHSVRPQADWRRSTSKDSASWLHLANLVYDHDQKKVLEIRAGLYDFEGLDKLLERLIKRQREKAWVSESPSGAVLLGAHAQTDRRYHFHVWDLLMHPDTGLAGAHEVVARAIAGTRQFPAWPVVVLVPDLPPLLEALKSAGFQPHRTLQQMILYL
ncbi:MAG: GNAT family N-acetyltransferase [Anaerolineae bacterium]